MTVEKKPRDSAGILIPPPLICGAFLAAGWYVSRWFWRPDLTIFLLWTATLLIFAAAALGGWGIRTLIAAKTAVSPFHTTTRVVDRGPFRYSRNPLYIALLIVYLGLSLLFRATGAVLLLPLVIVALRYGVIAREERYLAAKFGEEYRAYSRAVRRWL